MQFLVHVFGGIDVISGRLRYQLQALDPETGMIFIKTYGIDKI